MKRMITLSAVLLALATAGPPAHAATPPPETAAAAAAAAQAQVRNGTLLTTHGTIGLCPDCRARIVTSGKGSTTPLSTSVPVGYGAGDLATAYRLPPAAVGQHGTIAIIDAGPDPDLESDLAVYRAQFGLPVCTTANGCLTIANLDGGPAFTPDPSDDGAAEEEESAGETSLDVDMASAACPHCNLIELQVPTGDAFIDDQAGEEQAMADFATATDTAVAMGANSVSISFGYPSLASANAQAASAKMYHRGVAVVASAGDDGFESAVHTDWPQSLPWVVSVGGTSLFLNDNRYSETGWDDGGSGCETDYPGAIGQPASVSGLCGGHRAGVDVSAVADPNTGVAVYDTYAPSSGTPLDWGVVGGTSASAPFVAGLYARGGKLSTVVGPNTLYAAPHRWFTDVTAGLNAQPNTCQDQSAAVQFCQAGTGWDGPTGLGSPRGLGAF